MKLAFDSQTVRTFDTDGIMHVSKSPISKANVCKYQGKEIPDSELLGLDPEKWYNVYRDPEELAKAAHTFNNKPILNTHREFLVDAPPKEIIVGMTGDDAYFVHPYLYQSLTITDGKTIAGIETEQQREISSSYRWVPVVRSGVSPEGEEYDIVMTCLDGNHVAIVPDGRAGSDVLVYDSKPTGYNFMSKLDKFWAKVLPRLAKDANPDELKAELDNLVEDEEQTQAEKDNESEAMRLKDREEREDKDRDRDRDRASDNEKGSTYKKAEDSDEDALEKIARLEAEIAHLKSSSAQDAEKAVTMASDSIRREMRELRDAERICRPHVGTLACDSAEELYRATLQNAGVDAKDVHASALRPMVEMLGKKSLANDSAPLTRDSRADVLNMIRGGK